MAYWKATIGITLKSQFAVTKAILWLKNNNPELPKYHLTSQPFDAKLVFVVRENTTFF
jgi:hypothetical protein